MRLHVLLYQFLKMLKSQINCQFNEKIRGMELLPEPEPVELELELGEGVT